MDNVENTSPQKPEETPNNSPRPDNSGQSGEIKLNIQIPLEITIRMGQAGLATVVAAKLVETKKEQWDLDKNFESLSARIMSFDSDNSIINIRKGYSFENGWVTDKRIAVVEIKEELDEATLEAKKQRIPANINGIDIEVRPVALPEQLATVETEEVVLERLAIPAKYKEPPGFDDPDSGFFLGRIKEKMSAVFHVSPDAGFKNLSSFFRRIKSKLTATIYEWEPGIHISDVLEQAMEGNKQLKMVTQRRGVAERDATEKAVAEMETRIGDKFLHVFASVRGPNRLIPNSYHIKVASRDDEEFWLSSGNWKESNQPLDPTAFEALEEFNREWHAIIRHDKLAKLFRNYIDWDFSEAQRVQELETESFFPEMEFFVPVEPRLERLVNVTYSDELVINDEILDIQPLLTPDKNAEGESIFIKEATAMVERARKTLYIQNQSFNMTDENNEEVQLFFDAVKKKQREIDDVRIIFRDAHDFPFQSDVVKQQELIERLKDFGFNVSRNRLRLQRRCHTKGIIIDSEEVLLGSQNLTNGGALFNRDAALLVRNAKVASFFEKIFLFDWENLAHNNVSRRRAGVRRARANEPTPEGFKRVTLSEMIGERE